MEITPFSIDIPEAEVEDLKSRRVRNTRWPDDVASDWSRGTPASYARVLADRWADDFDWRAQEARLNEFPQFTTQIDGQTIHFVHVRSAVPGATPLLIAPRLSELVRRVHPDDRPACRSGRARRPGGGRLPRRRARRCRGSGSRRPVARRVSGHHGSRRPRSTRSCRRSDTSGTGSTAATSAPGSPRSSCIQAGDRMIGSLVVTDAGAIATEYTPPTDHLTPEEQARLQDAQGGARRGLRLSRAPDDPPAVDRLRVHRLAGRCSSPGSSRSCASGPIRPGSCPRTRSISTSSSPSSACTGSARAGPVRPTSCTRRCTLKPPGARPMTGRRGSWRSATSR